MFNKMTNWFAVVIYSKKCFEVARQHFWLYVQYEMCVAMLNAEFVKNTYVYDRI